MIVTLVCVTTVNVSAAITGKEFDRHFNDSTLRVDYVFGGGPGGNSVLLSQMSKTAGWYGKRHHLAELLLAGNGNIIVRDVVSGDTLYRQSFSSLFQEWISTPEAGIENRSFENSFLVPLPCRDADIILSLFDNRQQLMASSIHRYGTSDELVRIPAESRFYHEYVHRGGDPRTTIDVAIVAEGYTAAERQTFLDDARCMADEILSYEPFNSHRQHFNFLAVMTPSEDSGVTVPLRGQWLDTAFGSHYSTFHSPRYLTAPDVHALHQALSGLPYEHIIILANTDTYGGGGIYNSYLLSAAHNEKALPVTVHEFGHSFGGLADEYFYQGEESDTYPLDIEPWEPNITTLCDFKSKWASMLDKSTPVPTPWKESSGTREQTVKQSETVDCEAMTVGVYEGGGYRIKGVYRPAVTCRMRDNFVPAFCPVCQSALSRLIDFYTVPE